jgi:hypothetical protein
MLVYILKNLNKSNLQAFLPFIGEENVSVEVRRDTTAYEADKEGEEEGVEQEKEEMKIQYSIINFY